MSPLSEADRERYERAAYHEAGHAVAAESVGGRVVYARLLPVAEWVAELKGTSSGETAWAPPQERGADHLATRATVAQAGCAAVLMTLGKEHWLDGADADRIEIHRMCRAAGMTRDQAEALLLAGYHRAVAILRAHPGALRMITETLWTAGRVEGGVIRKLIVAGDLGDKLHIRAGGQAAS